MKEEAEEAQVSLNMTRMDVVYLSAWPPVFNPGKAIYIVTPSLASFPFLFLLCMRPVGQKIIVDRAVTTLHCIAHCTPKKKRTTSTHRIQEWT